MNPEQLLVVQHHHGPLRVQAVAGSGKTTALVHRIAALIERGENPARILAVTFSKAGAQEMYERLVQLGHPTAKVGTFHALGYEILRTDGDRKGWPVDEGGRYRTAIKIVLSKEMREWGYSDFAVVQQYIGLCKAALAEPGSREALEVARALSAVNVDAPAYTPRYLREAYERVEVSRVGQRYITFDDMLYECCLLLCGNPAIAVKWGSKYDFVLQDEVQDQSGAQVELARMLVASGGHMNYMVVGDAAQTIYGFRGADPTFFAEFAREFPNVTRVTMVRNYRSGRKIIEVANKVLATMPETTTFGARMTAERDLDGVVETHAHVDNYAEAQSVAQEIRARLDAGAPPDDFAVLLRVGAMSLPFEDALSDAGIPYYLAVGSSFWGRKEVKSLVSYLKMAVGRGTPDDLAATLKCPTRYFTNQLIARVQEIVAKGQCESFAEIATRAVHSAQINNTAANLHAWGRLLDGLANPSSSDTPEKLLNRVLSTTNYFGWLAREEGSDTDGDNDRSTNVYAALSRARRFADVEPFLDYVKAAQEAPTSGVKVPGKVVVTTCHRSKGLEWPTVYVPGLVQGTFPHIKAPFEEEHRLFYVAVTRARDRLVLSYPKLVQRGELLREATASTFFATIGGRDA
jgi:DNA helicase-2/ATP-dependent DNA helicase PcrA